MRQLYFAALIGWATLTGVANAGSEGNDCAGTIKPGALLIAAAKRGDVAEVKALLKHGANPNTKNSEPDSADDGRTALTYASQMGHLEVTKLLLSYGANPNIKTVISNHNKDDDGQMALMYASREGYVDVVKLLLSYGADISSKTELGETALSFAASRNNVDITNILLDRAFADKNIDIRKFTNGALVRASENGYLEVVKLLLAKGGDANAKDQVAYRDESHALFEASINGHLDVVELLLANGADVNAKNGLGMTALMGASGAFTWQVPSMLESSRVPKKCKFGNVQFSQRHFDVVKLLLAKGAHVNDRDSFGFTPVVAAAIQNQIKMVELLIENGADINIRDNDQRTILMHLVYSFSYFNVMKLLISKGIDLSAKDKDGNTTLSLAIQNACSSDMITLLQDAGAKR